MKYTHTFGTNPTVLQIRLVIFDPLELSAGYAVHNHRCDTAFCMNVRKNNKVSPGALTTLIKLLYFLSQKAGSWRGMIHQQSFAEKALQKIEQFCWGVFCSCQSNKVFSCSIYFASPVPCLFTLGHIVSLPRSMMKTYPCGFSVLLNIMHKCLPVLPGSRMHSLVILLSTQHTEMEVDTKLWPGMKADNSRRWPLYKGKRHLHFCSVFYADSFLVTPAVYSIRKFSFFCCIRIKQVIAWCSN